MAEALANTWKRRLAEDKAGANDSSGQGSENEADDEQDTGDEQGRGRILNRLRNNDKVKALEDKARAKATEAIEKKLEQAATNILSKVITIGLSSTIILLIIPYLLWWRRFLLGNWLHFPSVKKLKGWELGVWGIVTFILVSLILAAITLIIVAVRIMVGDIGFIASILWNALTGLLGL